METLFSSVPEITLYEKLKALIQEYNFDKFITLTEIESIGNFSSYYSRYKLDGVVSFQRKDELLQLKEKICDILEKESFSSVESWKVEVGYLSEDKLTPFSIIDMNENTTKFNFDNTINLEFDPAGSSGVVLNIFHIWSIFNTNFDSELSFIELSNILREYSLKNFKFNYKEINQFMICGDKDISKSIEFIKHKTWNIHLPQFLNPKIFEICSVKNTPHIFITTDKGQILYSGNPFSIKTAETIIKFYNLYKENNNKYNDFKPIYNIVVSKESNSWWKETDIEIKYELVNEINSSLVDIEIYDVAFSVISQKISTLEIENTYIVPVFSGNIEIHKIESLYSFANDLKDSLNFEEIKFDLTKNNLISHVNSFEIDTKATDKQKEIIIETNQVNSKSDNFSSI